MNENEERAYADILKMLEKTGEEKEVKVFKVLFYNRFMTWISGLIISIFILYAGIKTYPPVLKFITQHIDADIIQIIELTGKSIFIFYLTIIFIVLVKYIVANYENEIFIFKALNKEIQELKQSITEQRTQVLKTNKTMNREIVSINNDNITYDSKIIKHLFKSHADPANYLVNNLKVGKSYPLGDSIVSDAFSLASKAEFAKACCMVSDKKYINYYNNGEYAEVSDLLYYFKKQREYIEGNLNINRIFSFPFNGASHSKVISFDNENDSLILFLYMIFNYTSSVNTYLHIYNEQTCETEGTSAVFCSKIDYVSLMWYNSKFHYNAFITPQGEDLKLVVVNDNDILLHKFLEEDYTVRAKAEAETDEKRKHYCIKFKPDEYNKILIHLGLKDTSNIYNKLEQIIDKLPPIEFGDAKRPDFTKKEMMTRIDLFFHQIKYDANNT